MRLASAIALAGLAGLAGLVGSRVQAAPAPASPSSKASPRPAPAMRSVPAADTARGALLAPPADSATVVRLLEGVRNAACPLPGVATGGQPGEAHARALAKAGYRTVLDLRTAGEPRGFDEPRVLRAAGLELVSLPVSAQTLTDSTYSAFRRVMRKAAPGGVFVHCASGNRVGAVMIPWLVLDRGWDIERAVAEAKAGGMTSDEYEAMARDYVKRQRR